MPRRKPAYRRVTPLASRRETQRRAAIAVLALVIVVGGLGLGGLRVRRQRARSRRSARSTPARRRSTRRAPTWPRCPARASTWSRDDPEQALELLTDAYEQLAIAARRPRSAPTVIAPLRRRSWPASTGCTASSRSQSTPLFTFKPAEGAAPIDLGALVRGPDGVPYVIDRSTKSVYRIDLKTKTRHGRRRATARRTRRGTVADPALPRGRRPGPADPRRQERPVALAAGRRHGQGHADQGDAVEGSASLGRRHHGHQHVPPRGDAQPVQPVRRRPVRAADPALLAGGRRRRLPGEADATGWRPPATCRR